ncbi:CAAX prenyl protease 1 [Orchesella cincta]|uniref:CAAX prenyl protease 1 n=1 Tax=Orchesella cincta TaxID=48709 RepID=A0A1D2MEU1_ORCCI|nr:CAAX prenyl protease 1 [Orchesella cincta]
MGIGEQITQLQTMFESIPPTSIYWTIIVCIWVEYLFELYLCIRQRRIYFTSANKLPTPLKDHMTLETFEKARVYGIDKNNFSIVSEFYGMVVLTALLHYEGLYKGWVLTGPMLSGFGYWPATWDVEIGRSICFSILAMLFNNTVGIPLSIYSTFVLEE